MGLCKVGVCKLCGMFCFRKGERKWDFAKWEYANCAECSALEKGKESGTLQSGSMQTVRNVLL